MIRSWFEQIARKKWAIRSKKSLTLLLEKSDCEQYSDRAYYLFFLSDSIFRLQKTSDSLLKPKSEFPTLII